MSGADALSLATTIGLGLLIAAMLLTLVRLVRGPGLPDRILALDLLTTLAAAFIGMFAIRSGLLLYTDIAIALGLVGFLATLALARYLLSRPDDGKAALE